jgi:hypothetical protein
MPVSEAPTRATVMLVEKEITTIPAFINTAPATKRGLML